MLRRRSLPMLLLASLLAAGCADPSTLTLSAGELQRLVERRFPVERRLLEIFDVTLAAPKLTLLPDRNRIAAVLDIAARERLAGGQWKGQLAFDAELAWNPADQTLFLAQVRVQDLALADPGSPLRSAGERLGAAAAERLLEGLVVYRVPPERWQELQRRGVRPEGVTVTPRGVEIRLAATGV